MSLLKPHQIFLANLRGSMTGHPLHKTVSATCLELSEVTGLDFGQNAEEWISWIVENKAKFYEMIDSYRDNAPDLHSNE